MHTGILYTHYTSICPYHLNSPTLARYNGATQEQFFIDLITDVKYGEELKEGQAKATKTMEQNMEAVEKRMSAIEEKLEAIRVLLKDRS